MYSTSFLAYECELYDSDHLTGHETSPTTGRPLTCSICRSSRAVAGMCCCCFWAVNGACLMFHNRHWNIRRLQLISYTTESCSPGLHCADTWSFARVLLADVGSTDSGAVSPRFIAGGICMCFFLVTYHGCWPWMWQTCTFPKCLKQIQDNNDLLWLCVCQDLANIFDDGNHDYMYNAHTVYVYI